MSEWQSIETAPLNRRIMIAREMPNDEMAMAWLDRSDRRLYYAPQGGLVHWQPTHWADIPKGVTPPSNNENDSEGKA